MACGRRVPDLQSRRPGNADPTYKMCLKRRQILFSVASAAREGILTDSFEALKAARLPRPAVRGKAEITESSSENR